jgi:hypothetical protein
MSNTIGVIGQMYEDRKSKKTGVLLDRDEANKKLTLIDESVDGAHPFQISYAAFKSNWRKVVQLEFVNEPEVEAEHKTEEKPEATATEFNSEDEKIKDFVKALTEARVASVDIVTDDVTIMADDITICEMKKVENGYKMFMLPDIFTFTKWGNTFSVGDVHFNIKHGKYSGITIDCVRASLGDILQAIKTAAVEINLYGYID